jgi:hypothetical protein
MVHRLKKQVKGLPLEQQGFVTPAQLPSGAINFIFFKPNEIISNKGHGPIEPELSGG